MLQPQNNAQVNSRFLADLSFHEVVLEAYKRCGYGALMNFFRMLDTLIGLMCQGSRPNFKQLIFEKNSGKVRKNSAAHSRYV
ncbi:MAG: hypothetical protein CBARDCOR_3406 [uncultured Caballeronia sp.]|nr:MAG: hypothetical protein CBARDCOR_3406 [uncultured Caballeronia sp.]